VSHEIFVLVGQGQQTGTYLGVVTAKQVAAILSHNEELWFRPPEDGRRLVEPLGFATFSMHASAWDGADYLWCFYDEQGSCYTYSTPNVESSIPSWTSWLVHPQHIGEFRVPGGMTLVSTQRKKLIDDQ
jgi:hypothetical protein